MSPVVCKFIRRFKQDCLKVIYREHFISCYSISFQLFANTGYTILIKLKPNKTKITSLNCGLVRKLYNITHWKGIKGLGKSTGRI